jgi:hypothetical protein
MYGVTIYREDIIVSLQNRIESLKVKHATIKHKLDTQSKIPHCNEIELSALKKQKLAIKDELERINTH